MPKNEILENKIIFPKVKNPLVSIIIPVFNQYEYTKNCLRSILENTNNINYEIVIGDNHSTDETVNILSDIGNITVIRNDSNLGFLKNVNNAAKYAKGKYLCMLNNDTIVQKDWLKHLLETIESSDDIGIVGAKLLYPDGKIQEAGCLVNPEGFIIMFGNGHNKDNPEFNKIREVDYCSGCGVILKKSDWDKVGGFDERYAPAYYEDSDLAFTFKYKLGLKVIYQPKAEIIHFHNVTYRHDKGSLNLNNREIFCKKWQKEIFAKGGKRVLKPSTEEGNLDGIKYLAVMYNDLGELCIQQNNYEQALKYFEEALKHFDMLFNNISKDSSISKDILKQIAEQMEEIKRNILNLLNKLGEFKLINNDPHGALEHFKEILYYDSNNEFLYIKISKCLQTIGAYISAISFLDKSLKINPAHHDIYRMIGDIYQYNIQDLPLAIESYKKFVEKENNDLAMKAVVLNIIGHLYATI